MKKLSVFLVLFFNLSSIIFGQSVKIGTQVWSTKNLDVSKFRNGDPILEVKSNSEWEKALENKEPAWCYYNNDEANGSKYGKLYNWYAVIDPRGLAPVGWHIPNNAEWTQLEEYLGDEVGKKMKSISGWRSYTTGGSKTCTNCASWNEEYRSKVPCHSCKDTRSVPAPTVTHSGNGNNKSGFSGLPGGIRFCYASFYNIGDNGYWWSTTEKFTHYLAYFDGNFYRDNEKKDGLSVRCIKD